MKTFREVFITRNLPFGVVSQLKLAFDHTLRMQNGEAVSTTVTGEQYLQMLRDNAIPRLQKSTKKKKNFILYKTEHPHIFTDQLENYQLLFFNHVL